jgi:hypothetical protein
MGPALQQHRLEVDGEELSLLAELLEAEQSRLLIEIRHTVHRAYRDELRHRLDTLERLLACCRIG